MQLQWSVQPVELDKVPPLAIFSAYTLYTVEGSREGRKWYGLRLGFLHRRDLREAGGVLRAFGVRERGRRAREPAEKCRATDDQRQGRAAGAFSARTHEQQRSKSSSCSMTQVGRCRRGSAAGAPVAGAEACQGKPRRPRKKEALRQRARKEQRSQKTLEETLEILGASELEIDNGRGEILNDTGVRHLRVRSAEEHAVREAARSSVGARSQEQFEARCARHSALPSGQGACFWLSVLAEQLLELRFRLVDFGRVAA